MSTLADCCARIAKITPPLFPLTALTPHPLTREETFALAARAWPWTQAFIRHLRLLRPDPLAARHIIFGSDYSGDHAGSRFRVYGFVLVDAESFSEWVKRSREVRRKFLPLGRRMAFKNLNDGHRRQALAPFLEAAESLEGHVVAVAVTKEIDRLSTAETTMQVWKDARGLNAKWDDRAFEQMARIAHFFAMFVAAWSLPDTHVSWITDNDAIVANEGRLDDAHNLAARLSSVYVEHSLGEFMMNTVSVDADAPVLEDFVAIADLAAGMICEVMGAHPERPGGVESRRIPDMTPKSSLIASWFWHSLGSLQKTCIVIESSAPGVYGIGQLQVASV